VLNPTWLYVGLIYAVAVWLGRRVVGIPWRVAALFYILVLVFLFQPMTRNVVNVPADFLKILPPWNHLLRDHHVDNSETNDLTLQIVPWAHLARQNLRSLEAPLWNNFSGSGYPLLANGQSSALSPLRILALPLPLAFSLTAEAAMKILIALTFTFLYCRRRYGEMASVLGAICFGFSSFLIVWLHFPLSTAAAFLPAIVYFLDLLVERQTFARMTGAAIVWASMLLAGHPETAAHAFFLAVLMLVWILAVERPFRTWREASRLILFLGAAMTVAALLAAPFLAPFAEAIRKSKRFQELQVERNVVSPFSDYPSAIVLFQPRFFGSLPEEKPWGPARAESINGFAGVLGIASWFALLISAIRSRRWRSRETFYLMASILVLGIILAWPVINPLFHLIFGLAANARLRLLFCFLVALQTAAALDRAGKADRMPLLAGLLVVSAMLLYIMVTTAFPSRGHRDAAMLAILPSLAVIAAALFAVAAKRWRDVATMILLVFVVSELWSVTRSWNPVRPMKDLYPKTPLIATLQRLRTPEPFRIVGIGPNLFPNSSTMYGLEDIRAHDPMANGRYLGLLRIMARYDIADYFSNWQDVETGLINFLNVKYVMAPPKSDLGDPDRYRLVYDGKDGRIFENRAVLPRFFWTPVVLLEFNGDRYIRRVLQEKDFSFQTIVKQLPVESDRMREDLLQPRPRGAPVATVKILRARPTDFRLRVDAPRHSLVASSQPWWPGWKVEANGREVQPVMANGAFIAFTVRPGTSLVRVYYDPWTWKLGVGLFLATVLGLIAIGIVNARRGKRLTVKEPLHKQISAAAG
jgi:hypothetical protein